MQSEKAFLVMNVPSTTVIMTTQSTRKILRETKTKTHTYHVHKAEHYKQMHRPSALILLTFLFSQVQGQLDTTPPELHSFGPDAGTVLHSSTVQFFANVTDSSGLRNVRFMTKSKSKEIQMDEKLSTTR